MGGELNEQANKHSGGDREKSLILSFLLNLSSSNGHPLKKQKAQTLLQEGLGATCPV